MRCDKISTTLELDIELEGTFVQGYPETGPTHSCAGEPGMPNTIEDMAAFAIVKVGKEEKRIPLPDDLVDALYDDLSDELLKRLEDDEPDPDREYDDSNTTMRGTDMMKGK